MTKRMQKAIEVLKKGGIIIFPTDTAIGVGCRLDQEESLRRLFEIRRRPKGKPVLALVSSLEMAENYLLPIPQKVRNELIEKYWPGELTIILNCDINKVPSVARGGKNTLGIRFPKNLKLIEMIQKVGVPVVAPSANFSGEKTPFEFSDLDEEFMEKVDYVLKEKISLTKNISTVIDCTSNPWKILRKGALSVKEKTLFIDTSDNKKNIVGLKIDDRKYYLTETVNLSKTQLILPMIDKVLKEHSIETKDISEIEINIGPGSYTGLRVGLAIANALSFVLKIPINGKKVRKTILPIYS
jgi:L-threonylcarbamoyladenylate synthase